MSSAVAVMALMWALAFPSTGPDPVPYDALIAAERAAAATGTAIGVELSPEQQVAAGAPPNVVRLSIGIENVEDIIADLDQAMTAATK
jgi:hypothetical protein